MSCQTLKYFNHLLLKIQRMKITFAEYSAEGTFQAVSLQNSWEYHTGMQEMGRLQTNIQHLHLAILAYLVADYLPIQQLHKVNSILADPRALMNMNSRDYLGKTELLLRMTR